MSVYHYGEGIYVEVGGMGQLKPGRRHQVVKLRMGFFTLKPLHRFFGALLAAYCVVCALRQTEGPER